MDRRKPDLIYDLGMHRGEDTDFFLRKGFNVIAFEANPQLIEHCKICFQDAIVTGRLRIVEGAVAPREAGDTITFFLNNNSVWGTIYSNWSDRNLELGHMSKETTVKRVDLLEAFETYGVPHYMKIDIEGADGFVLESLKHLKDRPRFISLESEKVDFSTLQAEIGLLCELGYSKFKAVQQAGIPGKSMVTKTLDGRTLEHVFERDASGPFGDEIAQPWVTADEVLRDYEGIFQMYRKFGDQSLFVKLPDRARRVVEIAYKLGTGHRGPLAGWFDTHASL